MVAGRWSSTRAGILGCAGWACCLILAALGQRRRDAAVTARHLAGHIARGSMGTASRQMRSMGAQIWVLQSRLEIGGGRG
ncbi:hypothetical protein M0R45_005872 [Rubus argutus]|uniref:Secreted protein n=1 Tax=Rubus argutus TaxID=59490 RepID=A0AAW1YP70_RUBAR